MPDTNISQPTQHPKEKSIRDKFLEHWISIMYGLICCSMNMYFDPCVDYTKDSELFEKRKKQIAAYNGVICNITRFVKWLVSSEYHDYEDILLAAYNGDVEIKRLCRLHKRLSQTDVFALDPANIGRPGYQALIATPEYQFLQDIIHTDDNDTSSSDDEPPVYFGTDTLDCTTSDFDIARIVKEMEQSEQAFKEMRPVIKKQAEVMMENIRFTLLMYYDTQTDYYSASDARQVCLVRLMSCNKLVRLTEILLTDVTPYGERNAADIVHDIFGCDTNAAYLFDMYMKLKNKYHIMDYRCDELDFSDMGYHGFCRLPAEAVSALHAPLYSRQTNRCNNPTP